MLIPLNCPVLVFMKDKDSLLGEIPVYLISSDSSIFTVQMGEVLPMCTAHVFHSRTPFSISITVCCFVSS